IGALEVAKQMICSIVLQFIDQRFAAFRIFQKC
ncbi:Uncharacterized protein BM_BM13296, partial [Brugia malayi]